MPLIVACEKKNWQVNLSLLLQFQYFFEVSHVPWEAPWWVCQLLIPWCQHIEHRWFLPQQGHVQNCIWRPRTYFLMKSPFSSIHFFHRCPIAFDSFSWFYLRPRCEIIYLYFIHGCKSTQKFGFIDVKHRQSLVWNILTTLILFHCEQTRHPSCAQHFYIQIFNQNAIYNTLWNAYYVC